MPKSTSFSEEVHLGVHPTWDQLLAVEKLIVNATKPTEWRAQVTVGNDTWKDDTLRAITEDPHFLCPTELTFVMSIADNAGLRSDGSKTFSAHLIWDAHSILQPTVKIFGPDAVMVRGLAQVIREEMAKPPPAPPPITGAMLDAMVASGEAYGVTTPIRGRWDWVPSFLRDTTVQAVGAILAIAIVAIAVAIFS